MRRLLGGAVTTPAGSSDEMLKLYCECGETGLSLCIAEPATFSTLAMDCAGYERIKGRLGPTE